MTVTIKFFKIFYWKTALTHPRCKTKVSALVRTRSCLCGGDLSWSDDFFLNIHCLIRGVLTQMARWTSPERDCYPSREEDNRLLHLLLCTAKCNDYSNTKKWDHTVIYYYLHILFLLTLISICNDYQQMIDRQTDRQIGR